MAIRQAAALQNLARAIFANYGIAAWETGQLFVTVPPGR
jgi:hypothetical protein